MTMEKKIKSELMKMSAIMLVLVGLGIYAYDFVLAGLQAKLALNSSIFILAGFAAWITFRHVLALKNETIALKALQVDYGSLRRRPTNPYRHPAVVFDEPELLGQGYRMITEEFSKQGELKITNATVQVLLHDVDQRINDRKSTIMYFSGLMVFLGLLGAFMGLMKTVHSVSDLIGGMDLTGGSGTEGMAKMIEGMKAPLNGMSVGFSSSLFGLMTSMVLGALERCMTSAMKALRNDFEHWLSNVADLEGNTGAAGNQVDFSEVKQALDASSRQLESLRGTVTDTATHSIETRVAMGEMARAVQQLSETVAHIHDPKPMLKPITDVVSELAQNQMAMLANFRAIYDRADVDRAHIEKILGGMSATVDRMNTLNGAQLHKQLDNLAVVMADSGSRMAAAPVQFGPVRPSLWARIFGRSESGLGLRSELRRMMLGHRRLVRRVGNTIDDRLARMEAGQDRDRQLLGAILAHTADQQARLEAITGEPLVEGNPASEAGLSGARMEMDVLRRRLNAEIRDEAPQPATRDQADDQPGQRAGGKA